MKTLLFILLACAASVSAQTTRVPTPIITESPFSTQGEIVNDKSGNKIERNITPNTVKYEINYSDASARILAKKGGHLASFDPNDKWMIWCNKDAMSDQVSCRARLFDLYISVRRFKSGLVYSVIVGTNHYPGTTVAIRFDADPPISGSGITPFAFDRPEEVLSRMAKAKTVTTRYHEWPHKGYIDNSWELYGFEEMLRYLKWAAERIR